MGTLEFLGAAEWFPATVLDLQRSEEHAWSVSLCIASGAVIPLRATGVLEVSDKKSIDMVVACIALVMYGAERWIEFRGYEEDDAFLAFAGSAIRLELDRYNTSAT
jgi:hypothetical protein